MTKRKSFDLTRRAAIKAGLTVAAVPLTPFGAQVFAQDRKVTMTPHGFETAADMAKAEAEGEFTFYSHDSEPAIAGILEAFNKDFPKIKGKYVRAQNGTLFSRTVAERSANKFGADVIQFSEPATALDFQKRGGYARYVSPQSKFYAPEHQSNPIGDYFWTGVTFVGLAYNTDKVKPEDAPKGWKDIANPIWNNGANVKMSNSGMQFVQWYELRKLYGDKFWSEFAKVKPRGFDSRAQQFERLAKGDDKICVLAEFAGYLLVKQKGAPVAFVAPADGLPAAPLLCGIADRGPNPEASRLFMDWQMSLRGQNHQQTNQYLFYGSVRTDAPPMPDGKRLADYKLLSPTKEMDAFVATRDAFNKEWNAMLGL
jgi:iron(III) transport system substrate-binding protein